ncbi:phosphorothioated DNA-binding restriction endonuclease [Pseudoalteromonas ruthenica]|uniref:phosphorothioated DNA-binding restriction endonuclease n=1 Tax=Pseudoalteromonas ruthenica TaxID=151081 RepID=UPI00110B5DD1|nr:HNH endonuclease [Pseudoalteromonas ruthenica]TMO49998.1 restriction endonuclease [Pseudoalteromonas ruthenica]TMO52374.1 restriction endonuclease [Pseudoalteromonas ruthenica]
MTPNDLRAKVLSVKRWSRADQRAPNKPLMMAYALANYIKGHGQMFSYEDEVDKDLHLLLKRFGPSRKIVHPEYPFWRLINDGFWRLDNAEECLPRKSNTDPPKSELIKYGVTGGFNDEAYQLLKSDTQFAMDLLQTILSESFPESIIPEITAQLGLEFTFRQVQKREPNFRREVLNAYNGKCAICGFDARLNDELFALEAAHIKWKQFNGPCSVNNGLALCSIHHKALDKGAITITSDMHVKVASSVNGGGIVESLIWDYADKKIHQPRQSNQYPLVQYFDWHDENVFRG